MTKRVLSQILIGSVVLLAVGPGTVRSGEHGGQHSFHVPLPNQELFLHCRFREANEWQVIERVLPLAMTMAPQEFSDELRLPAPYRPVRIRQYLPKAKHEQRVIDVGNGKGKPAIRLGIIGPKQSYDRWLITDHPDRNRLTSLIATWRYHAVASRAERNALHRQFLGEPDRPAKLLVRGADGGRTVELPAEPGVTRWFDHLRCRVTIRQFFPHFAIDPKTTKAVNQSDQRVNPAALVEVERGGISAEHWVFSRFPEFKGNPDDDSPLTFRLDCPEVARNPVPDFVIVTVGGTRHEVWSRYQDAVRNTSTAVGKQTPIPDSNYAFTIQQFIPGGRLDEQYVPSEDSAGAATVLRVEVAEGGGGYAPVWLELGKARTVDTAGGLLTVLFSSRPAGSKGGNQWSH